MKLVLFADTHGIHNGAILGIPSFDLNLPKGDVLVFAGDFCNSGSLEDAVSFKNWLDKQDFQYKIVVPGNHDVVAEKDPGLIENLFKDVHYLVNKECIVGGIKFFGSPWQPRFQNWAFNLDNEEQLYGKFKMIPNNTDILITHCPPYGIMDVAPDNRHCGSRALLDRTITVKPQIHVFGHIHAGYGRKKMRGITFVNASLCTEEYSLINKPVVYTVPL